MALARQIGGIKAKKLFIKGKFEGAKAPSLKLLPLPRWGRGIKGDGVENSNY
jgi:hypothetical protein